MKRFPPATAIIILFAAGSCDQAADRVSSVMPRALAALAYEECYNGVGFFRTEKAALSARMPDGFVVGDGSMLDPRTKGMPYLHGSTSRAHGQTADLIGLPCSLRQLRTQVSPAICV